VLALVLVSEPALVLEVESSLPQAATPSAATMPTIGTRSRLRVLVLIMGTLLRD
jgi:hypothetical protein